MKSAIVIANVISSFFSKKKPRKNFFLDFFQLRTLVLIQNLTFPSSSNQIFARPKATRGMNLYSLGCFGLAHDLIVRGQLLQHHAVVIRAGGQDVVGQVWQVERVLFLQLPSTLLLLLLQHLLVELHVLLLGAGQLLASLRIGVRLRRNRSDYRLARLVTHQRADTHSRFVV